MITEAKQLPLWYRQHRAPKHVQPTLGLDGLDVDSTKPKRKLTRPADAGSKETFRLQHDVWDGSIRVGRYAKTTGNQTAREQTPSGFGRKLIKDMLNVAATPPPHEPGEPPGPPSASLPLIWEYAHSWGVDLQGKSKGYEHHCLLKLDVATMDALVASGRVRAAKFILLAGVPYVRVKFSHWEELPAWLNTNTSHIDAYRALVLWIRTEQKPRAVNEQDKPPTYQLRLDNAGLCDVPDEVTNWLLWQDAKRKQQAIAKEKTIAKKKRTLAEQQAMDDQRRYHQQQTHREG